MIQETITKIIEDLGATGLLVVGLYWILYHPLRQISRHMENVNRELGEIRDCIKAEIKKEHGKD